MVYVRHLIPSAVFVAAFMATLPAVPTYAGDLPPLLSSAAFDNPPGHVRLTSATDPPGQPFAETPEPLFTPTQIDDPWQAALPDRNPAGRHVDPRHRQTAASLGNEPRPIHPPAATPITTQSESTEPAATAPASNEPDAARDQWASHLEQAEFDEGFAVDILGIVQWTLIVLVLCAGSCVLILRRFSSSSPKRPAGTRRIQILETTRIAPGSSLQLVQIDSHRFLVAVDGTGVKSVTGLPDWFEDSDDAAETPASIEANLQLLRSQPVAADPEQGKAA